MDANEKREGALFKGGWLSLDCIHTGFFARRFKGKICIETKVKPRSKD